MRVAIDTSVLVGLINPHDIWHTHAQMLHDAVLWADITPTYFDCAVSEAISVAIRRLYEKQLNSEVMALFKLIDAKVPRKTLTWVLPDVPRLYSEILELMQTSSGELNFNDALIALACREREIPAIASFDGDFHQVSWLKRLAAPADVQALQHRPG